MLSIGLTGISLVSSKTDIYIACRVGSIRQQIFHVCTRQVKVESPLHNYTPPQRLIFELRFTKEIAGLFISG